MAASAEVEALRKAPIFRNTEQKHLQLLAFLSSREVFHAGEALCLQGDRGDSAFVLLEGEAGVWVHSPAGRLRVATLGRHEIVGEIAVLCDIPRTADVIADGDVTALRIGKDVLLRLLRDAPDMGLEMMRALALRLNETTQALFAKNAP